METTQNQSIAGFIERHGITMEIDDGPDDHNRDGWDCYAYRLTIHYCGRTMPTPFYLGLGHKCGPRLADVLDSLATSARCYLDGETFEDFAAEFGYDEDSRKAEATYKAVMEEGRAFAALLDSDALHELIECEPE